MLNIGELKLDNKAMAAPMAGFTDIAWRIIARKMGAGLVFSEMVSVEGLWRGGRKTLKYLKNDERAKPFGLQLFGSEPESFEKALDKIFILRQAQDERSFDLIDINMGCPVRKVVKRGAGSALMKTPKVAAEIIKLVRKKYNGPLTIKIRSGWSAESINAVEVARIAEDCGADAVIIHPRTQNQFFKGEADWQIIKDIKDAVKIPVIGNGDVKDKESFEKMLNETGCDGVMIGREAIKRPWIFRTIHGGGELSRQEIFQLMKEHFELLNKFEGPSCATVNIKKFIAKYLKGIKGGKVLLRDVYNTRSPQEIFDLIGKFKM